MNTPDVSPTERWKEDVRQQWMEGAAGWRKWAPQWEVQSRAATEAIVRAAQVTPGMQILDLASGTGEPALTLARAVRPGGHVTATDLVPEMVATAQEQAQQRQITNLTCQQADAEALPFPAQTFDRVTCRLGIMFFPNVGQALREIHRVLKPGGRAAFVALGPLEQHLWQWSIVRVFQQYISLPPPEAGAPHLYRFAQPGTLARALQEAGFRQVQEASQAIPWPWPGPPEEFWTYRRELGPFIRQSLERLPLASQASVIQEVLASIGEYYDGQQVNFTAVIVIASGVR
jgi:ubiquinone/menaquinone biosynthesis C-methylase UbiE